MQDPYYNVDIPKDTNEIKIIDRQSNFEEDDTSKYKKYMNNRQLILLENLVDIIHDVVAEGNLSYNGILSIDLIVKSYTALYGYQEEEGWELLNENLKLLTG